MSPTAAPDPLVSAALGALGKLRECVAAARNLEHLLASRDVGPKMLDQVVPDVAAELLPFDQALTEVIDLCRSLLGLESGSLGILIRDANAKAKVLLDALASEDRGSMNAKRRLMVERSIKENLPLLSAALSHAELLVEATSSEGVPMSVFELLSSTPDAGSNRPHRRVFAMGPTEELHIKAPARIGLRCLGMLSAAHDPEGATPLALVVGEREGLVSFRISKDDGGPRERGQMVKLPIYAHTPHSLMTIEASLVRYSGKLDEEAFTLLLPRAD